MSATIIAFPRPAPPPSAPKTAEALAEDPQVRLTRAFAALEQALAAQRAAVNDWRSAIGTLKGTMNGLSGSLHQYQGNLDRLADRVDGVSRESRRLEAWADGVLAEHPTAP